MTAVAVAAVINGRRQQMCERAGNGFSSFFPPTDGRTDGRGIPNLLHSLTPDDQIMIRRRVKKQHARPGRRHRRQISNSHALANDLRQLERKKEGGKS